MSSATTGRSGTNGWTSSSLKPSRRCNPIERLNGEIKRRTEVAGIFPKDDAIVRLVGALLLEQNDEWAVPRARYMTLETIAPMSENAVISLPAVASLSNSPAPHITVTISASYTPPWDSIRNPRSAAARAGQRFEVTGAPKAQPASGLTSWDACFWVPPIDGT